MKLWEDSAKKNLGAMFTKSIKAIVKKIKLIQPMVITLEGGE